MLYKAMSEYKDYDCKSWQDKKRFHNLMASKGSCYLDPKTQVAIPASDFVRGYHKALADIYHKKIVDYARKKNDKK